MKRYSFEIAFALGALVLLWVAASVASSHLLVLVMTALIGAVYLFGAIELRQYRCITTALSQGLDDIPQNLQTLNDWLITLPAPLHNAVRHRVEGERQALPGPALTPYLVGLLVMLGMLGTFLGMVVTLNGAVFALEGSSNIAGIRAAFSEPIKGLGLAFGTSVAGVATSAMLGLMSSLARRERAQASQTLDSRIASSLRKFSLTHQRHETFKALQQQSQALPQVVAQLQAMMLLMAQTSEQINAQLRDNQQNFHKEVNASFTGLAQSVDQSLRDSLSQSMQMASDGIRPVAQATMTHMAEQVQSLNERLLHNTQKQLSELNAQFSATAASVSQTYSTALDQNRAQQSTADQLRLDAFKASLESTATALGHQWQAITTQTRTQATHTLAEVTRLMDSSEALMHARIASEAQWAAQHTQRSEELSALLRTELSALREAEESRGQAAVARLSDLQTEVTAHLTTLGTALEDPIKRLIETASEAPKAAAEVIGQLRQEISISVARDNALLEERTRIMDTLSHLLDAITHASTEQRSAIDNLVSSCTTTLNQTNSQFINQVSSESAKLGNIAAQVTASAVDVASLGETFAFAVRSFNETNEKFMGNLQRIERAIDKSMTRSDEQLAYYVAQAREIIDLSITSQKDVLETLQQHAAQGAA